MGMWEDCHFNWVFLDRAEAYQNHSVSPPHADILLFQFRYQLNISTSKNAGIISMYHIYHYINIDLEMYHTPKEEG